MNTSICYKAFTDNLLLGIQAATRHSQAAKESVSTTLNQNATAENSLEIYRECIVN